MDFLNKLKYEIVDCFVFFYNVRCVSIFIFKEDGFLEKEFVVIVEILNKISKENFYILICSV